MNPTIRPNPNLFLVFENGKFVERGKDFDLFDYRIGRGSVVFDYDNDGDLDLFVVNQQPRDPDRTLLPARCLLYRNDVANGNWLKVELVGKTADTHGLGSRVEVMVNGKLLSTEIDGGSSHLSQNSTIAHFGLGNATKVESVTVKWIGGKPQTITDVAVNQKIIIEQSEEKVASSENNSLEVSPGFFTDRVFIEYELAEAEPIELRVYDVRGHLIEQLASIRNPVAKGIWQWDVARYLPRGVYVFQLRTENTTVSKRAVKL
ncbi:MAG: T9SS type A sorting domain-containing protein [Saprospiraceae bacterium]|nr:T9SS type A sorting domain-containing protein [Saprospiraceae bacterium]